MEYELKVDPERNSNEFGSTGIYVRAKLPDGKWGSADIISLDKESLKIWLRSRGGENEWAENVIGILFQHGHLW